MGLKHLIHLFSPFLRALFLVLAASAFLLLGWAGTFSAPVDVSSGSEPADTSKLIPVPAETLNAQLTDVEGKRFKLSDYAGQVIVVNLWATWCGPCRPAQLELDAVAQEYRDRGVVVLGLTTLGNNPKVRTVKAYLRKNKLALRTIYDRGSFAAQLAQAVNVRAVIPQIYVITKDGKFLTHFEGYDPRSTPASMRKMVDLALTLDP